MTRHIQAVLSAFATSCFMFFGCSSQPKNAFYLQNEVTGFIQGPFNAGHDFKSELHALRVVLPSDNELTTLEILRSTFFKFQPFCLGFEDTIENLNDVLNETSDARNKVSIRVEFPPSWDLPEYSAEDLELWGYKKGYGGSRKSNLPKVLFNTAGELSVYNMLHALMVTWPIPFRFSIDNEIVVLKIADYREGLIEYVPPHNERKADRTPSGLDVKTNSDTRVYNGP